MAKVLCGGAQNAVGAGNTGFTGIGLGIHSATTIETLHDQTIRTAGTFSNLSCTVKVNSTGISTLRLRKNLANGNQSISIPSSATGFFEDVSNIDTVTAGNVFTFQLVSGSGGVTTVMPFIVFEADGNTTAIYGGTRAVPFTTDNATRFIAIEARPNAYAETVEAEAQTKIKVAGTWKNMDINVSANNRVSTTTWTSRINGVDGNMLVSVPAGTSGHFEDTSNTDVVSVDDLLAIKMITGSGGGQLDPETQKTEIEYSGNAFNFPSGTANDTVVTTISNATNFVSPMGGLIAGGVTELFGQIEIPIDSNFSNLLVHVINNNITVSNTTVKVRKNGADGNGLVSIPAGATGFFEDTVNGDSFVNGDKLAYQIITPATSGEIGISMISTTVGDTETDKTFAVNSILEPACDADFCDNFNDFAFQKLPTFRDNFNYSTQASADANWISSDVVQIRANAVTEEVDYDWTQSNAIEALSFDLGADTVNKEKWALRFKFILNSFTKVDASPNLCFIGLATNNGQGVDLDGEGIGFQCEVRTVEPVDFNLQHRDDATSNKDLVGNIGGSVLINVSTGTFYVEVRRESSTKAVCDVYSDAQFTTLLGSGSITMDDLTSDLRHILIVGRDNNGMNLMDGTIDDLEFWNGGQQGDVTFEDGFKQKTITFDDDFSSYADQTEADASWAIVGTTIRVNPSTDVMDWDFDKVGGNRASAFDLGAGGVSDTQWTLRWKQTYDTVGDTSSSANIGNIGLYDSDETRASSQTQDFITFKFFKGTNTTTTNFIGLQSGDGIILNDGAGDSSFATQKNPVGGTTLYFELKRTSATTYEGNIYSDATYTTLVDTLQETVSSTATGLRFIKIQNDDRVAVGGGSFNGTMDDIQFWNGDSTLIRWLGAIGNDVRLDIINKRINFDPPTGVDRDELIAFDLQTILDGSNASDENWTLRFKINTDTLVQGTSEQSASLLVGLDNNLDSTASATHNLILFRTSIDQGGAGPQFGAISSSLSRLGGGYFSGTGTATQFPIAWSTGTRYVEVKRLSPTEMQVTLFTDASFTDIETNSSGVPLIVQDTIDSGIINLRYIRVTTESSAVANDTSYDGSIDDIEFYNGVSVPRTPISETKDDDDTFITDNYINISGTKVGVNTTTQVIDWTSSVAVTYNEGEFNDVFGGLIDTNNWALRFKLDVTASSIGADATANNLLVGFSDDNTSTSDVAQDYIGWQIFRQNSGAQNGDFRLITADGVAPQVTVGTDVALTPVIGIYYVELERVGTTIKGRIYSDPDYSILLGSATESIEVGITSLRFLKVMVSNRDGTGDHTFDGTIDNMQFWNGQSALDHQNKWRKVDE